MIFAQILPWLLVAPLIGLTLYALLETQDPNALHDGIASGECEACGAGPMIAALLANQGRNSTCRVLTTLNSGDVTGDHHSVVGYACAAIYDETSEVES